MSDRKERRYMGRRSVYFPARMLAEIEAEAHRLDRSLSWMVKRAWDIAKGKMPVVGASR